MELIIPKTYDLKKPSDIESVRFSQDSISALTKDQQPLSDLISDIQTHGWQKKYALQVVRMEDGSLVSLNNRRLYAIKTVFRRRQENTPNQGQIPSFVRVAEFSYKDSAPKKLVAGLCAEYRRGRHSVIPPLHTPPTYGDCIFLRSTTRNKEAAYGFTHDPIIRDATSTNSKILVQKSS